MGWVKAGRQGNTYDAMKGGLEARAVKAWGKRAQAVFVEKGHGRVTGWEVEVVTLNEEGKAYLAGLGWPQAQVMGRYRVEQHILAAGEKRTGERLWLARAAWDIQERVRPRDETAWVHFWWRTLRGHWQVENRSFYILDVRWREDAQTARRIGRGLHHLRAWALTLLRRMGFGYVADGQRACQAAADARMAWFVRGGPCPVRLVNS